MKLSKENIQFIDNYLKKSEVVFDDLRIELVDHISSAVQFIMDDEQLDFYEAFKKYMISNKKYILKAGMVDNHYNFSIAFMSFFKFLIKKEIVLFALIIDYLFYHNYGKLIKINSFDIQIYTLILLVSFSFIWAIVFYVFFKKRFFVLENNFIIVTILYQVFNFFRVFTKERNSINNFITILFPVISILFVLFMIFTTYNFYTRNKSIYEIN